MGITCQKLWELLERDAMTASELKEDEYRAIDQHVDTCVDCRKKLEHLSTLRKRTA